MLTILKNLRNDKRGVTAIEYGLIAAFIAVLIIAGVKSIGTNLSTAFGNVNSSL